MAPPPRADELVLSAGSTAPLLVSYASHFCLYQLLLKMTRERSLGLFRPEAGWLSAVQRLAAVYLPLGPFNYLEYAVARAASSDHLAPALGERAAELGAAIAGSVAEMEALYERDLWPRHQAKLAAALDTLRPLLTAHKDSLLEQLAGRLWAGRHPERYEVLLVADCHEPTGAYSHPTVVSVETFGGLELAETIVHELAHVLAQHAKDDEGSLWAELSRQCRERGRPIQFALHLFHLLLFHAGGETVREILDPEYVPHTTRKRLFEKLGKTLGIAADGERLERLCSSWQPGVTAVGVAVRALLDDLLTPRS